MKHMYKYSISLFLILFSSCLLFSQEAEKKASSDSIVYKQKYGLRVGIDLSRLARRFLDDDYSNGFEIVGDYRISKRFYIAAELGTEENTEDEDFFNFTSSGSYLKVGFDYNTYQNWRGMQNAIFVGMRYGISSFSQTLNSFTINNRNQFFNEGGLFGDNEDLLTEVDGLRAQWVEAVFGLKAEIFTNVYLSVSARLNFLLGDKQPDSYPNLWSPGFNRISEDTNFGFSYNYTITYLIPIFKKK